MTANRTKLIADAQAAGYTVEIGHDGYTEIFRMTGRHPKKEGIFIYGDDTAFLFGSNSLAALRGMRSYRDMRSVLGLPVPPKGAKS